jgi:hypothetical protein
MTPGAPSANTPLAEQRGGAMRIEYFCFVAAALAALGGMGLGLYMGLAHDFTLAPAHAHLNLLGWGSWSSVTAAP